MKKFSHLFSAAAAASLLLTGCAATGEKTAEKPAEKPALPETLQNADRDQMRQTMIAKGETMLKAMQAGDYEGFTQYFPPEIKEKFPKKAFDQFPTYIGKLEKWQYLAELTSPVIHTYLWKTTIRRKDSKGAEITLDMLFHLSAAKQNGRYVIVGSWFK